MATVLFVLKDGTRVDITGCEIVQEYRCDYCGQFLATDEVMEVRIDTRALGSAGPRATGQAHARCVALALPGISRTGWDGAKQ